MSYTHRVSPRALPELMDGECSYGDFRGCLRSLEQVNRWSLGYRPTLAWLRQLERPPSPLQIVDVGSGGGDLLRQIAAWAAKRHIAVKLTGIDLNPYAERAAAELTPSSSGISWVTGDALEYEPQVPIDIVVSSLMTHHLEDDSIITFLKWMEAKAQLGWFINDLERSQLTARAFGWLARLAGWHRFVIHDGPVSFQRAFQTQDWQRLLTAAGVPLDQATITHWRPGRLCVGRWKGPLPS